MLDSVGSLPAKRFETPALPKHLATASRSLAELKGVAAGIPNQGMLSNTLALQGAKDCGYACEALRWMIDRDKVIDLSRASPASAWRHKPSSKPCAPCRGRRLG